MASRTFHIILICFCLSNYLTVCCSDGWVQCDNRHLKDLNFFWKFKDCPHKPEIVTNIFIYSNKIKSISGGTFEKYKQLRYLQARNNTISTLENGAFDGTQLSFLGLNRNLLKCVPNLGGVAATLTVLQLDNNKLHLCERDESGKVEYYKLSTLKLSENNLIRLPAIIFHCPNLNSLDLEKNNLKILPGISSNFNHQVSTLLSGNRLICSCQNLKSLAVIKNHFGENHVCPNQANILWKDYIGSYDEFNIDECRDFTTGIVTS